ncbi:MAG TPA: hypothetical protein VFH03_19720 [Actinoplanes sp.]|nr:hypothetical protein [Actinoplanes sp.]
MTGTAASLPDFYTPPPDATPSAVTAQARRAALGRRTLLKLAAGGALGIGLAALDLVSRALPGRATNPNPVLSVWNDCRGFFHSTTVCVPNTAYYGTGTPRVCNGSWHRNDKYTGSSVSYDFTFNNTSCSTRNAWRWVGRTANRKCSDGWTYYRDGSTYRNSFSICRTAI